MLTQYFELLITQLHIFSINFISVLSKNRCLRYLVFPALFLSISMVFIDYTCITSVTEYSQSIRQLLKLLKVHYNGRYTIFQAIVMYVTFKTALNIQFNVSNKPCLYFFACWYRFMYFF